MTLNVVLLATLIPISIFIALLLSIVIFYYFKKKEWRQKLQEYPSFSKNKVDDSKINFQYGKKTDENLTELREKYELEKVAGKDSEIQQILNLMKWTHMLTKRSPNPPYPEKLNAINLIHLIKTTNLKLNCYMYATILNEVLLSLGFKSRKVHLYPMKQNPKESHWVNIVYSKTLSKWIMIDPDFCIYIRDEDGTILGLLEVREKIIKNEKLFVNKEQQYNASGFFGAISNLLKRKTYHFYLSKNIFRFETALHSVFDYDSRGNKREFLELIPKGYNDDMDNKSITNKNNTTTFTTNSKLFMEED